jgi:hypothetical protein
MSRPGLRLSRPLYESLPWLYIVAGIVALAASYRHEERGALITAVGILGFLALLAGIVILLRRRDYRALRASYSDPDALFLKSRDDRRA